MALGIVRKRAPALLLGAWCVLLGIILFAGLRPLRFHPPNGAHWTAGRNGISFQRRGLLYSWRSLRDLLSAGRTAPDSPFSVELLLTPRRNRTSDLAHIVSDDEAGTAPNFLLAQYGNDLVLKARFLRGNGATYTREADADGSLHADEMTHIVITSAPGATVIYVNGLPAQRVDAALAVQQFSGRLLLGGSGAADQSWIGDLYGLALYQQALSPVEVRQRSEARAAQNLLPASDAIALFYFGERGGTAAASIGKTGELLDFPAELKVFKRHYLVWDFRRDGPGLLDVVVNVAGLIPFGFVTAGWLVVIGWPSRRALVAAIAAAATLSLGIELTQAFIPGRDSSSTDVMMNTLGAASGAWIWLRTGHRLFSTSTAERRL